MYLIVVSTLRRLLPQLAIGCLFGCLRFPRRSSREESKRPLFFPPLLNKGQRGINPRPSNLGNQQKPSTNPQSVVGNQPLAISRKQFAISKTSSVIFTRLSAGGADNSTPLLIHPSWCSLSPHHHNRLSIFRKYGSLLHRIKSTFRGRSFVDFLVAK